MPDLRPLTFFAPPDWLRVIRWTYFDPDKTSAYRVAHGSASLRQTAGAAAVIVLLLALLIPALAYTAGALPGLPPLVGGSRIGWDVLVIALLNGALFMLLVGAVGDDSDLGVVLMLAALLAAGWATTALLSAPALEAFGAAGAERMAVLLGVFLFLAAYGVAEVANEHGGLVSVGAVLGVTLVAAWAPARALLSALVAEAPFWLAVFATTFGVALLLLIAALLLGRVERAIKRRNARLYGLLRLTLGALGFGGLLWLTALGGWRLLVA